MNKELWVGAIHKNGAITEKPLLYVKEEGRTAYSYAYNEDIKPIWYCLDDHVKFPGIRYPQNLECVIMCSERREDICSFIQGIKASYCMIFHGMKRFFGGMNSGEYSSNSGISYECIMRMLEPKKEEEDEEEDEYEKQSGRGW